MNAPEAKPFTNTRSAKLPSPYRSPRWLLGCHAQTIWPSVIAPKPFVRYKRERWNTPDSDFIDVDFVEHNEHSPTQTTPILVLFHGLEGSSQSSYARALMAHSKTLGWRGLVAHFRGCGGELNHLARAYHSGDSEHIGYVLHRIRQQFPNAPLFATGVSLGGNAMLRWLGLEAKDASFVRGAFAISPPHDLEAGAKVLSQGFNRIYTQNFLNTLKEKTKQKALRFPHAIDLSAAIGSKDFYDFDHHVTAPLHGFSSCYDYWRRSSCKQFLQYIQVPTTVLNALNDPFQPTYALAHQNEVSARVRLHYTFTGGHVGFLQGILPGHQRWLVNAVFSFFTEQL